MHGPVTRVNEVNLSVTRNLTNGDYLRVDQEELMRGIDYKSPSHGIALLIANKLSSERALQQAKGRVGRYGEPCDRYVLRCIAKNPVDDDAKHKTLGRINERIQKLRALQFQGRKKRNRQLP